MTEAQAQSSSKPPCHRDDAMAVLKRLRDSGHVAYFAGGCVRDELLGIQPKDYDVATDAPPKRVRELFSNTQAVGAAFGVILVRHGKSVVEVATFRSDGEYLDGRHPSEVHFTNAEEDAKRRDFTINGLFLDPIENRVIDYVGGQEDLRNRIVRAIGDANRRFEEDHLRLLRAIRFAGRFEFEIEPATASAIRSHAPQLKQISPERIAEELRKILTLPDQLGEWGWHALLREFSGLSDVIFRFLPPAPPLAAREHTLAFLSFSAVDRRTFGLSLAAAALEWVVLQNPGATLHSLVQREWTGKMCRAVKQSLRISNEELDDMQGTLEGLEILLRDEKNSIATLKRFLARPTADLTRTLFRNLACKLGPDWVNAVEAELNTLAQTEFAPPPFITGDDLTAAGLMPGKLFKIVLDQVYDAQLESRINSRDEAMTLALHIAKENRR